MTWALPYIYGLMAFLVWTGSLAWGGPSDPPAEVRGIIAIDPGHGGKQAGSRGPQGSPEKEICLALARQLALFLEPDFRVILTREDDYDLPLLERTGIANHHRADLFISLHAAAGFAPATGGITIFTFKPAEQADGERSQAPPATPGAVAWHQLQIPHAAASRAVATLFQQQFETMPGAPPVRTSQGPLLVLAGANMPALLIEVGQLTHAATEALLSSPDGQTIYAQAMARAIDSFFAAKLRSTRP